MKKTTVAQVPYDKKGNLIRDGGRWSWHGEIDWRPNEPFSARLTVLKVVMGSDSHVWWADGEGHRFPMWTEDLVRLMHEAGTPGCDIIALGVAGSQWMVTRRGPMYGIRIAERWERT